ncbi:MAG: pyridoxal phosphate-dependent aminotransferase [Alphaproteobacteria bacterium]|nr:pyridoxal phosphate-dependent aminotransferase [Alphaproteobacteria bacterium]
MEPILKEELQIMNKHEQPDSGERVDEGGKQLKFRPVLHALTANPGAEMMRYARGKHNIITLGQGEGDAPTPDFICEATMQALRDGRTFYGPVLGREELRAALSEYYERIYGLDVPSERIFVTSSGSTAMHLSLAALVDKGDEVVAITPIWKNLIGAIELTQATTKQVALDYVDNKWTLDVDKLFSAVNERTKVILIVTPSNPTGWTASREEMKQILDFARERGIWVLADEVYGRLVYEGVRAPSFLDVAREDDLLLVVNSFSKSWAMTGWRLGWIVGPLEAEPKIRDVALYNKLCPPTFTQYGAIAALEQGEDFLKQQLDLWRSNRDYVVERFSKMGNIHLSYPEATFYAFFKVDGEPDCIALTKRLIDEAGVLLSPGSAFGQVSKGYIRLCFAVSRPRLAEALDRIEAVLKK